MKGRYEEMVIYPAPLHRCQVHQTLNRDYLGHGPARVSIEEILNILQAIPKLIQNVMYKYDLAIRPIVWNKVSNSCSLLICAQQALFHPSFCPKLSSNCNFLVPVPRALPHRVKGSTYKSVKLLWSCCQTCKVLFGSHPVCPI